MQQAKEARPRQQRNGLKTIGKYIKSFEPIVIRSLRQYTLTTSVNVQARILDLLVQLVFLRVDYLMLDSERVFIDFVLKQFEQLEQLKTTSADQDSKPLLGGSDGGGAGEDEAIDEQQQQQQQADAGAVLAKSYLTDLYESFDSETSCLDALNPLDTDACLNRLVVSSHAAMSAWAGARADHDQMSATYSSLAMSAGSANSALSLKDAQASPLLCHASLRQQEHQRQHLLIPKLFDFLIILSHEKKPKTVSAVAAAVATAPMPTSAVNNSGSAASSRDHKSAWVRKKMSFFFKCTNGKIS